MSDRETMLEDALRRVAGWPPDASIRYSGVREFARETLLEVAEARLEDPDDVRAWKAAASDAANDAAALREHRRVLIDALRDAEHGLVKAKVALERAARGGVVSDDLKLALFNVRESRDQALLVLGDFTTGNA